MKAFTPYFNFPETTDASFNFYNLVFGGELISLMLYKGIEHTDKLSDLDDKF